MAERAMPSFTKSPPALVERFGAVMDRYPDAERKKMFGYPAAFRSSSPEMSYTR